MYLRCSQRVSSASTRNNREWNFKYTREERVVSHRILLVNVFVYLIIVGERNLDFID